MISTPPGMMRKIQKFLAFVFLVTSLFLLIWGFMPNPRKVLERRIPPAELKIPTPVSLLSALDVVL